jgi:hypothetical protein
MELKEVIKYVLKNTEGLELDNESILDCATQIYVSGRLSEARLGIPPKEYDE